MMYERYSFYYIHCFPPLALQQATSQIVTAIALGICGLGCGFEGEAKLLCDSLTLKVIAKASQFNLVKTHSFKSQINCQHALLLSQPCSHTGWSNSPFSRTSSAWRWSIGANDFICSFHRYHGLTVLPNPALYNVRDTSSTLSAGETSWPSHLWQTRIKSLLASETRRWRKYSRSVSISGSLLSSIWPKIFIIISLPIPLIKIRLPYDRDGCSIRGTTWAMPATSGLLVALLGRR